VYGLEHASVCILGAGPTGLGAAHRLQELGLARFLLFEKEDHPGGLASSFVDEHGFTWDVGGHVQFSHYRYFDDLMDNLLGDQWFHHQRESWIWICERFVPYPFQNNIGRLPREQMAECLRGLFRAQQNHRTSPPRNFAEWIEASFGEGIARRFLLPYNFKVWAYPPSDLAFHWVGDRVAKVDLERVVFNILDQRDDVSWGPNNTFRFPLRGGTGEVWRRMARRFPANRLQFGKALEFVETARKRLRFSDGTTESYDVLISTIPVDELVMRSDLDAGLKAEARRLRYSTVHIVGIGLRGQPPEHLKTKCWMYFPEDSSPFYRATVFSNYSPNNVPDPSRFWSLMVEVSESPVKPVCRESLLDSVVNGLLATRLVESKNDIVCVWRYVAGHGYPTPSLERDPALSAVQAALEAVQIYSRGRFGAWKYEVSNQDHSLMQGVELVNRLASGIPETTVANPELVNRMAQAAGKGS
jgi:protoporphyrinogen oxidase